MTVIAPTLQAFFTDRLTMQLHASPRTIASYRDTLRLLLRFAHDQTGTVPSALDWDDLDEPLIAAFLEHLETDRHNSARTRNLRLTAIRSLFHYASLRHPEHAAIPAGHIGLIMGRTGARLSTPLILDWLTRHSTPKEARCRSLSAP
jgi:site-specific recombinase XerD